MTVEALELPVMPGALAAARGAITAAVEVPADSLDDGQLADALSAAAVLESRAAALKLSLLAEVERRKLARSLGATGTDAWAARLTGTTRAVMAGGLWLARMLEEKYAATRVAFADGGINEAQARVIVKAAELLPRGVTREQRIAAESTLVVKAVEGMDPQRLRQAARRMLDVVSRSLADEHEATLLGQEERRAEHETWLSLADNGDGTFSGRFVIPELHGHILRAALERLTSPKHLSRNKAGETVQDGTGPALNRNDWFGLGFIELIEHLPTKGFGPNCVTVIAKLDYSHLLDGLASAGLDTGTHCSAGEARRLSCNAGIIPAVLGGRSAPLDLGRERRLHSTAQRRALALLHDSCAVEGCQRPFAWCDVHHPDAWSRGGRTDLGNAVPLCGFHHRRAHDSFFDLSTLAPGEVRFRRRR